MLWQMHLKPWGDPIDLAKLTEAIRHLDPAMSDVQIRALFKTLKDRTGLVPIPVLIPNLTGQPYETVEFRNKIFKRIYNEIYPDKEQTLI